MKRRRTTIIAGNLIKIVEYTPPMPRDNQIVRSSKSRATTEARKVLNYRTAQGKLETKLASNFCSNDYFVTFTYKPGLEPKNRKEAEKHKAQYIRRLRSVRCRRGQELLWIFALENKHGEGRYHFHAVINATGSSGDSEEIISLWDYGIVHIERLFDEEHDSGEAFNTWLQIARYMTKERPENGHDTTPNGAQLYNSSRNLKKPIKTSEWIDSKDHVQIPAGAVGVEHSETETEFSVFNYYKYMTAPIKQKKELSIFKP